MLNFFLNKGGAGVSLSRQETVNRLNPIIRSHYELNQAYSAFNDQIEDRDIADRLAGFLRTARIDIGKLAETVFSAGGVAYNGVDMRNTSLDVLPGKDTMLDDLLRREKQFQDALDAESEVQHQIRTQAILKNIQANSQAREKYLQELSHRMSRQV